jgi:hypothetical protein
MSVDTAAAIRSRAELARRLAAQMHNDVTRRELLQLVDELLAEADKLEAETVVPIRPEPTRDL